ncbi:MAG: hypothetical protein ACYC4U_11415 [Pirellulaceae bacterium]
MHQGKRVHDWGQTGSSVAMLANVNRNPKKRRSPYGVADFVPRDLAKEFRVRRGIGITRHTLHALKPFFEKDK